MAVSPPEVTLAEGDDASGMATMLAELLRDNMKDFPSRARAAALTRGDVVLSASDRQQSITLSFRRGEVVVSEGVLPGAPVLAGPWLEMAKLCSGQLSPVRAVATKALRVTPGRRPTALAGAGIALSVPPSFYGDEAAVARRKRAVAITVAVTVAAVALGGYAAGRRRRRRHGAGRARAGGGRRCRR